MAQHFGKRRIRYSRVLITLIVFLLLLSLTVCGICMLCSESKNLPNTSDSNAETLQSMPTAVSASTTVTTTTTTTTTSRYPSLVTRTTDTIQLADSTDYLAKHMILVDAKTQTMIAEKGADEEIAPASMTKLMTLVVAAEALSEEQIANDSVTITNEILQPVYERGASIVGYQAGETAYVRDMFYGTALASGADAAVALSIYVGGSLEGFVSMMNEKAVEIGLQHTHFCNPTGLDEDGHYSTAHDIARLLEYTMSNPFCYEVLTTQTYQTQTTPQHPQGFLIKSIVFFRCRSHELPTLQLGGGKTGFTRNAGQCLASWFTDAEGHVYVAVVGGCEEHSDSIYDTLMLVDHCCPTGTKTFVRPTEPVPAAIN